MSLCLLAGARNHTRPSPINVSKRAHAFPVRAHLLAPENQNVLVMVLDEADRSTMIGMCRGLDSLKSLHPVKVNCHCMLTVPAADWCPCFDLTNLIWFERGTTVHLVLNHRGY